MRKLSLLILLFLFLVGCSSDLGEGNLSRAINQPANLVLLNVSPNPATVQVSQSVTLIASGGTAPYHYNLVTTGASCSVNITNGVVTAPAAVGTCYIAVTDSSNGSAIVPINVTAATATTTYAWQASGFGSCSASCGGGTQSQTVTCMSSVGTAVADAFCTAAKPAISQTCNAQACLTWHGNVGRSGVGTSTGLCSGASQGAACSVPGTYCISPYTPDYSIFSCY